MTKEPITSRDETLARLSRVVGCNLTVGGVIARAVVTEIAEASHLSISTEARPREGASVWIDFVGGRKNRYGFNAQVLGAGPEGVRLSYPDTIYRINLRDFCRVSVPEGSLAVFSWRRRTVKAEMIDLSAGGAAFSCEPFAQNVGAKIKDIELRLIDEGGSQQWISIPTATVRRIIPQGDKTLYGVAFHMQGKTANALMYYVRRREREILRQRQEGEPLEAK